MADDLREVDIIFAGGGAAGPNNMNDPTVITPALAMSHLAPTSKTTTFWRGNKSEALNGRCPTVATGQLLGGGSSINFTMYARASASDYDDWNTSGWKSNDLLPLLRKTETYHLGAGRETHGYDGPAHVSYADCYAAVAQEYLDVVAKLGVPLVEDVMNLKTGHGCQRWAKWINPETGHRQDAAHCFVHPLANNKSLHILTKTKVTRVLFDGTKATGVEIIANREQDADADPTPLTITARKLVVVSAGAIGTPLILQRSGIGLADRLSTAGVKTLVDLPGVGATYEDHTLVSFPFHVPDDTETFDSIFNQDPANMERLLKQFAHGKGLLASNLVDAGCKMRPDSEDRKEMGDEFNQLWENYFEPKLDKPVMVQAISNGFPGPREAIYKNARLMGIGNFATYPTSRGSVYITSADPYAPPDFDPRLFDRQVDVDIHVWGYKKAREVARRMPHYRGEYVPMHPKFLEGSAAACAMYDSPPDAPTIKNIEYTAEDNAAIEAFIRQFGETCWHSCATVPMKAREQNGCLDPRLNVYGTQNLKVSGKWLRTCVEHLSILPGNVGANTYSTALLVGEKAAMLIAEDLGLKSP